MQTTCFSRRRVRTEALLGILAILAIIVLGIGTMGSASAQSIPTTASGYLGSSGAGAQPSSDSSPQPREFLPAPGYCTPCLYYSGDFDSAGPNPDGLLNGNMSLVPLARIFTPFTVPSGHTWYVNGLLINTLSISNTGTHTPKRAGWSIWTGVSAGVAGTLIYAGANKATFAPTGRTLSGVYTEFTVKMALNQPIALAAGTYFLNVTPQCTNSSTCSGQLFYETDVEDALPAHRHGPPSIEDDSFLEYSGNSSYYVAATTQGAGLDLFSFGIEGTCVTGTGAACSF